MYYDGQSRMQYNESGRGSANQYGGSNGNNNNGTRQYSEMTRDMREGKSPQSRRMYMESKEQHHDKAK